MPYNPLHIALDQVIRTTTDDTTRRLARKAILLPNDGWNKATAAESVLTRMEETGQSTADLDHAINKFLFPNSPRAHNLPPLPPRFIADALDAKHREL